MKNIIPLGRGTLEVRWRKKMARLEGVEPPTYGSEVRRSILLSYRRATKGFNLIHYYSIILYPYLSMNIYRLALPDSGKGKI